MRVRRMSAADFDAVVAIEQAGFEAPWTITQFEEEYARSDRRWLVAEGEGAVVGFGGVMIAGDEAHVMDVAVAPEARRRGHARSLLEELEREAARAGADRMTLEVRESNDAGRALYARAGYAVTGRRRRYYPETGEDALVLWSGPLASRIRARDAGRAGEDTILAIETSCDETAAAVLKGGREIVASVVASQVDFHARFGGVVPEIASRKHTEALVGVIDDVCGRARVDFSGIDALAVTQGPGLVGALVVGLAYAKGLSLATGLPLVGVNHLEGHIYANLLAEPDLEPPLVALLVSGGHTALIYVPEWGTYRPLGQTLDDAAGEAFDKVAKVLGLGYPGGPVISRLAAEGDPGAIAFPRAMMRSGDYDFSLSGLKTAVIQYVNAERAAGRELRLADIAASFEAAVVDVQVAKTVRAAEECGVRAVVLAGGVAANPSLRESLRVALAARGVRLSVPPFALCTDNAAMIGAAAHDHLVAGRFLGVDADAASASRLKG